MFFDRKPASETPWTKSLWIYDLRTNQHFTLKTNPLWLRDKSLEDTDNLPDPAMLAAEIVEDLQAALDQFAQIAADLARNGSEAPIASACLSEPGSS